jgi:hypothetical protein
MKTPITRRIAGISRDTYQPQRIGYPIYHMQSPRRHRAHPALIALVYGGSTLITITLAVWAYSVWSA